jgi:hypothetical protein
MGKKIPGSERFSVNIPPDCCKYIREAHLDIRTFMIDALRDEMKKHKYRTIPLDTFKNE